MAKKKIKKYLRLRYLRSRFGLTQEFLGGMIGVSDTGYSLRENGKTSWQLNECIIIRNIINEKLTEIGESAMTIEEIFYADEVSKMTRKKSA
ncbi:MAG TPA: helix-turn-helix domain-containing protein [Candidatus Nitrosocosmicus sp.]|nr:helix-turn-helix domain-containing protein [Candidatus Nitrosocosmicus sp.]